MLRWWLLVVLLPLAAVGQATASGARFRSLARQAGAASQANHLAAAARLYGDALRLRPGWAQGWWGLGTAEYDRSRYAAAAHAFERLEELRPRAGSAHAMLGLCLFELGKDRSALREIDAGLRLGVLNDAQMRRVLVYHQGILLRRVGRFEEARDGFSRLCRAHVEDGGLDRQFGLAALRERRRMPQVAAGDEAALGRLGQIECMAARSQFSAAHTAFRAFVRQYPSLPHAHDAYGGFLLQTHDPAGAVRQFKLEIAGAPRELFARLKIAATEYRVNSAAGLPYAEEAVRLAPRQPLGHYFLGLLLADTGQYRRAAGELEQARRALPHNAKLEFALGTSYTRLGEKAKAAEAWKEFLELKRKQAAHPPVAAPAAPGNDGDVLPSTATGMDSHG